MSRFLIACGGTGGHLAPGIALGQWLKRRGHRPLLLISSKRIDARLIQKYPELDFEVIPGAPLLMGALGLVKFGLQQTRGLFFSWRLIRRERPVAIIGFGGFTTASIIVAGCLWGVPVALHEANRVVGRAVRSLARFADRIYVPRGVDLEAVGREKIRHSGLPVRDEISRMPRGEAAEMLGLDADKRTLVVMGGSQGAQALNNWADQVSKDFAQKGVQTLVLTGPAGGAAKTDLIESDDGEVVRVARIPFSDQMAALYSIGDLVISRSGAGTLAELVRCRMPAILVPYPHAADNHQAANAWEFSRRSGSLIVPEDQLDRLASEIDYLLFSDSRLTAIGVRLHKMDRAEALELMFTDLEVLAGVSPVGSTFAPWEAATL